MYEPLYDSWENIDPNTYSPTKQKILRYISVYGPISSNDLKNCYEWNISTIYKHLRHLQRDSFVEKIGKGPNRKYIISPNSLYSILPARKFTRK